MPPTTRDAARPSAAAMRQPGRATTIAEIQRLAALPCDGEPSGGRWPFDR